MFQIQIKSEDIELLFGKDFDMEKTFQEIDSETDGKVCIQICIFG